MIKELGRLLVSLSLIAIAGGLYWCAWGDPDVGIKLGFSNTATGMITAISMYWLKPEAREPVPHHRKHRG